MDFTSIDFETANGKRTSACSLGIAVVLELAVPIPSPPFFENICSHVRQ